MKKTILLIIIMTIFTSCTDTFGPRYFKSIGKGGVITYPGDEPPIDPFLINQF